MPAWLALAGSAEFLASPSSLTSPVWPPQASLICVPAFPSLSVRPHQPRLAKTPCWPGFTCWLAWLKLPACKAAFAWLRLADGLLLSPRLPGWIRVAASLAIPACLTGLACFPDHLDLSRLVSYTRLPSPGCLVSPPCLPKNLHNYISSHACIVCLACQPGLNWSRLPGFAS